MTPPQRDNLTVVVYDRDCGFCRWSLARVLDLDRRRALRPVALQDPEADDLLWPMARERRFASAHIVTPDGSVYSGGHAVEPLVRLLPAGAPLAPAARLLSGPLDGAYRVIVHFRGLLGRLVPTAAIDRAAAEIDRRSATSTQG
jgi:predicted DCC family thiol-disulfide oxidoreductase YuxK